MGEQLPLLAKLNEVFSSAEDLMVTLLLDGSGSVAGQWEEVRQLSLDLVKKLEDVDIQVIQFSTAARTECPFTKNKDVLKNAIQNMKIMGGGSNMADGFKLSRTSLDHRLTTTSHVVFFVTDGGYSGDHPGKEITALLETYPASTIIGVVVGGVNVDQLRSILPVQQVFQMEDYSQLNKVIKGITVKEPPINIEILPGAKVQKSREDLMLKFRCKPDLRLDTLPAGTKIHFLSSNFFFAEEVKLQHPAYLNKPPSPDQPINILLWGQVGSGKSSFINGMATLFWSTQEVYRPLMAYKSDTRVTKDYSRTSIADILDDSPLGVALKEKLKINFWDPWGLPTDLSLIHFLEGRIRDGTQMDNFLVDHNNVIHAIIFMVPIGTSQDSAMLDTLLRDIVTALDFNIRPKVVVNFINTVKCEDEVKKAYNTIQQAFCLPAKDVIVFDNYDNETYRNMNKDLQSWRILQGTFAEAIKKIRRTPLPQAPTNGPSCQNSKCTNFNKEVLCTHCGEVPQLQTTKVCFSASCPLCGPPPKYKICASRSCQNFEKPVRTPHCPFCGEVPQPEPTL